MVHGAGGLGIQRERKLFFPIKFVTRITECVVTILRTRAMARQVGSMSCNFVSDDSVLHVFLIGKPEVLFGRDVAEHGGAVPSNHGRSDGGSDVIVAWSDVSDERAERVKGSFVAKLFFFIHLLFDLVEWNVAGALDHDLHIVLPGFLRQLAESFEFRKLGRVAGVGNASRTQAVAERERNIVLGENLADVVKALVQKILLVMMSHPLRENGSATAHDSCDALRDQRQILHQHASVNSHVIHALLGLFFDYFKHYISIEIFN